MDLVRLKIHRLDLIECWMERSVLAHDLCVIGPTSVRLTILAYMPNPPLSLPSNLHGWLIAVVIFISFMLSSSCLVFVTHSCTRSRNEVGHVHWHLVDLRGVVH